MMMSAALFLFASLPQDGQSFAFPISRTGRPSAVILSVTNGETILTTTEGEVEAATRNFAEITAGNSSEEVVAEPAATEADTIINSAIDYSSLTTLPRHPTNDDANLILLQSEEVLRSMQESVLLYGDELGDESTASSYYGEEDDKIPLDIEQESVYANSYVDLGKVDTVGFDFDYTLVTYTKELLELIYDMALTRLVEEKEYPREMLTAGLKFDPFFSIRG